MARYPSLSVQTLGVEFGSEPYFLDPFALESFLDILSPDLLDAARERRWKIVVFKGFLTSLPIRTQSQLKQFCEVESSLIKDAERWMVDELLALIFHGDTTQRTRAEMLVLARRRQQSRKLLLLSNCERLFTLPNAQTFFFGSHEKSGDLPVDFNLLYDMNLHRRLFAANRKLEVGEYANAILEAMNALSTDCRVASGLTSDGITLMEAAFGRQSNGAAGVLTLCEGMDDTARNERNGYRDFFQGAVRALRNPNAHTETESEWIQTRFGDKIKVAKALCFLSLLFEKLDSRPVP